ncbi:MAG: GNAT family N-acetyltransferase [Chloroflexi bacterium]|nr:GNAT family N-acetyltransferase [Chloroflexota bacterium]
MTITRRPYNGAPDLARMQMLNAAARAQRGICGYLHPGDIPHRIYNGLRRYAPEEIAYVWEDDAGALIAYCLLYPEYCGFDLQIHPDWLAAAFEADLLAQSEDLARAWKDRRAADDEPCEAVEVDLFDCDERRIAWALAHGFTPAETPDNAITVRALRALEETSAPLPDGFTVRSTTGIEEAAALAEVHSRSFDSDWTAAEYARVMRSPGYDAEREWIVVAPDGRFAAFCIYWVDTVNKSGYFEPVGTHADFRRLGLARALMVAVMRRMQALGLTTVQVNHDMDNPASTKLYEGLGFARQHTVTIYSKRDST